MSFQNNIFFQKVRDYSVSKEIFELHHNPEYDLLITFPKPSLEKLPSYYESEDYISHTDGKRSLFERMYHLIKTIALKNKVKLINAQSQKGQLLDIGAGTGDFLVFAKNDGWQITGIEPSAKAKELLSKSERLSAKFTPLLMAIAFAFALGSIPVICQPSFFAITKKSPVPAPISKSCPF